MPYGVAQETIGHLYYLHLKATSETSGLNKALVHLQAAVNNADDKHPALPCQQQCLDMVYNYLYNATGILEHYKLL